MTLDEVAHRFDAAGFAPRAARRAPRAPLAAALHARTVAGLAP
jgi:hypothetical protein